MHVSNWNVKEHPSYPVQDRGDAILKSIDSIPKNIECTFTFFFMQNVWENSPVLFPLSYTGKKILSFDFVLSCQI